MIREFQFSPEGFSRVFDLMADVDLGTLVYTGKSRFFLNDEQLQEITAAGITCHETFPNEIK